MPSLDYSMGALLIGVTINVMLYGVQLTQTFEYYLHCGKDFRWLKCLVVVLFIADTVNSGLNVAALYYYLVTSFGNWRAIATPMWMSNSDPAFTSMIAGVVQLFYAYRIRKLTGNWWVFAFIVLTALGQSGAGLAATISLGGGYKMGYLQTIRKEVLVWILLSLSADIVITYSLVRFLRQSRTGYAVTDDLISKIMRMTVQTGLLTTIWATIDLILYLAVDHNDINFIFTYPLCKLYSVTLMSSLNARSVWNKRPSEPQTITALTSIKFGHHGRTSSGRALTSQTGDSLNETLPQNSNGSIPARDGVQGSYISDQKTSHSIVAV